MRPVELVDKFKDFIIRDNSVPTFVGDFLLVDNDKINGEAKKYYRIYNLWIRRSIGKLPIIFDDEKNIIGTEETGNRYVDTLSRRVLTLVDQGWLPKKWVDLTPEEIKEVQAVLNGD